MPTLKYELNMIQQLFEHEIRALVSSTRFACYDLRWFFYHNAENLNDTSYHIKTIDRIESLIHQLYYMAEYNSFIETKRLDDAHNMDYYLRHHSINIYEDLKKQLIILQQEFIENGISCSIVNDNNIDSIIHTNNHDLALAFSTALYGILRHALVSACFGSRVICKFFPNCLDVSYVGDPVPDEVVISIFNDGCRSLAFKKIAYKYYRTVLGLFAAKKIIDANNCFLSIRSEFMNDRNVYAESLMAEYLNSISEADRFSYIHKDIPESNYFEVENIFERIMNNRFGADEKDYLNTALSLSDYIHDYGMTSLVSFEDTHMSDSISKTNITIYYGKAKRHIVD